MSEQPWIDLCRRLRANVERGLPDQCDGVMTIPASAYSDAELWQQEMAQIFLKVPLLAALTCDLPEPGDYLSYALLGRPLLIVRGDDGAARVFLNVCRHRGAKVAGEEHGNVRSFICPYHSWTYDRQGQLVGVPGKETFGEADVEGLLRLPAVEQHGAIFSALDPAAKLDLDAWLGPMGPSLSALRLADFHPYRKTTTLESPNWKLAADGYLDGYHIGYLHKQTIGAKAITNRNTYDLLGPHARIGFATKRINEIDSRPEEDWHLPDYMSLVHYVFPNVSISGGHGDTLMLSRLFPGPTVGESTTVQHQYFREPLDDESTVEAETKRRTYEQVVRDEDCATIFGINEALPALTEQKLLFGRNEPANQHLHRVIQSFTANRPAPTPES